MMADLEDRIRALTEPRNGVYPRPWTTDGDPTKADVLIVGASSAKTFRVGDVGNHDRFLDSLWNRNGMTCRAMYAAATTRASRTRPNLERLAGMLASHGLTSLQTNVSCASAPYDADLSAEDRSHGTMIFRAVVEFVPWKAIILYGVGASTRFGEAFGVRVPTVPSPESEPKLVQLLGRPVFVSPTLAPPSYRSSVWPYLERVVLAIAADQAGNATSKKVYPARSEIRRLPTAGSSTGDQRVAHHRGVPTGFIASDANLLVWERLQDIAATTGLSLRTSETQCSLNGGPEHASTTRVFRQQFVAKKPELLLRDDVMRIDPSLKTAGNWAVHTNPAFHKLRTDDLELINRILSAIDKFARASAP